MRSRIVAILSACGMVVLIVNRQIVLHAAAEGISLCMQTVVPTLFPFLILSSMLNGSLMHETMSWLSPIARLIHVPAHAVALLVTGLLGGYPTGASGIAQAFQSGRLQKWEAKRMLAFGSNAGPAFIFGFGMTLFRDIGICLLIWGIHIVSVLIVALLTPGRQVTKPSRNITKTITITESMQRSVSSMALICGWIVLFHVLISVAECWIMGSSDVLWIRYLFATFELTNGICRLQEIEDIGVRIILFSTLLSFGGFCVYLQTKSVCGSLGTGLYFPGKVTQAIVSFAMAYFAQLPYQSQQNYAQSVTVASSCVGICILYRFVVGKYIKNCSNLSPVRV